MLQDNQAVTKLEENGKFSSHKRTRHINIRYFFITDQIDKKNVTVKHCPTDELMADFMSKPLQGAKFIKFKNMIKNLPEKTDPASASATKTGAASKNGGAPKTGTAHKTDKVNCAPISRRNRNGVLKTKIVTVATQ